MEFFVDIKKTSGKSIIKKLYDLETIENKMLVRDFLTCIIREEVRSFNKAVEETRDANPDTGYEYLNKAEVLKVFSEEEIEDQAKEGKISFGVKYNQRLQSEEKAITNAIQCFEDGVVAVFIDGKRYEKSDEEITIKNGSEVAFVRLTFLAGRLW